MLSQEYRLRKKGDIDRVWKRGRTFVTPIFSLKYGQNKLPVSRFAVVVGTKVSKRAVVRNKIKRRIREAIRPLLPQLRPGVDVLCMARKGIEEKDFAEINKTIGWSLKKIGLLKP